MTTPDDYTLTVSATIGGTVYSKQITITVEASTGADSVVYTLDTTASGNTGGSNGYDTESTDITIGGVKWNATGNTTVSPWRIGGKNISNKDRTIYNTTAINYSISNVDLVSGEASSITVNSVKLIVASDANFSTVISEISKSFTANSTLSFERPEGVEWKNCYYKVVYNVTVSGNSNKFVEFKKLEFTGK